MLGFLLLGAGCGDGGQSEGPSWVAPDTDSATDGSEGSGGEGEGTVGGETEGEPEQARPDVEIIEIPESPPELEAEVDCIPLDTDESLASVSPQGHAWLTRAQGAELGIRVVDAQEGLVDVLAEETLEVGVLRSLQAWDGENAAALTSEGLWALEAFARVQVTPPASLDADASMCGDLSRDGLLLTDGVLFERRADDNWWQWDSNVQGERQPREIVRYGGDCLGVEDTVWLTAGDGTLWQLSDTDVARPARFPELIDTAATRGMVALLESETLWVGHLEDEEVLWEAWSFPGGTPANVSAAQGAVWMVAGDDLLRYDGSDWQQIRHDASGPFDRVLAHPGGAWLAGETELCSVVVEDSFVVEGVRPYLRGIESEHAFRVWSSADPVAASVAGQDVPLSLAEDGAHEGRVVLDALGWHELVLTAGEASRTVPIKRVPDTVRSWATDIEPLYTASCTGSACHGGDEPTSPRALSSYDIWRDSAAVIRTRVLEAQTMPPPGQGDGWDADSVEVVAQWIEGGMLP